VRFVHLKAQATASREVGNKARELVERIVAFCRNVGGSPNISEETFSYAVTCTLPSATTVEVGLSSHKEGSVELLIGRGRKVELRGLPPWIAIKHRGECIIDAMRVGIEVGCKSNADKFLISVSKEFKSVSIEIPPR